MQCREHLQLPGADLVDLAAANKQQRRRRRRWWRRLRASCGAAQLPLRARGRRLDRFQALLRRPRHLGTVCFKLCVVILKTTWNLAPPRPSALSWGAGAPKKRWGVCAPRPEFMYICRFPSPHLITALRPPNPPQEGKVRLRSPPGKTPGPSQEVRDAKQAEFNHLPIYKHPVGSDCFASSVLEGTAGSCLSTPGTLLQWHHENGLLVS